MQRIIGVITLPVLKFAPESEEKLQRKTGLT